MKEVKIKSIKCSERKEKIYDITVEDFGHYILDNGIVSHNTTDLFAKKVQGGGKGVAYNSSTVISMSKAKDQEGTGKAKVIHGSLATCTAVKNRFGRENGQVKIAINYDKGLVPHSGLFDIAEKTGHIISPSSGYYTVDATKFHGNVSEYTEKKMRKKEFDDGVLWETLLNAGFNSALGELYKYSSEALTVEDVLEDVVS
jgi:hypothetical protein